MLEAQITRMSLLQNHHAGVPANLPTYLVDAHVNGKHSARTTLQEAVGKSTCRGSHIHTDFAARVDGKMLQGGFQLEPTPAYILRWFPKKVNDSLRIHCNSTLLDFLVIYQHLARKDHGLGLFPRFRQATLYEQPVQTKFRGARFRHEPWVLHRRAGLSSLRK